MSKKEKSANWNIAATHYLTSGFFIPALWVVLINLLFLYLKIDNIYIIYPIFVIMYWLWLFLWVMYSASYLKKRYVIMNPVQVTKLSTIYFLVINTLIIFNRAFKNIIVDIFTCIVIIIHILIFTYIFYLFSKKYIKQDENIDNIDNQVWV